MTPNKKPLTTKPEFEETLMVLLREAHQNGIDVEGGWECRNGANHPDWEAVIVELSKPYEG